jgi:hypothetical protein
MPRVCPEPGCGKAFIQNEGLDRLGNVFGCGGPVAMPLASYIHEEGDGRYYASACAFTPRERSHSNPFR